MRKTHCIRTQLDFGYRFALVHFVRLQEAVAGPNGAQADFLVQCSRHFRAILHECVLELKNIAAGLGVLVLQIAHMIGFYLVLRC